MYPGTGGSLNIITKFVRSGIFVVLSRNSQVLKFGAILIFLDFNLTVNFGPHDTTETSIKFVHI